ncbi:MAG: SsrA-binding protein SmpB [Bacteroidetes bacterium HLUCCA01]|nr:MAG: SsrA-binding protein SmpB [Bacteroidetes bacterium HLUCCA01]
MAESAKKTVSVQNRKARHDFHIDKTWEAGLVLQGTEVKSLRQGNCSFVDSFAYMNNGEIFLKDFYIKHFEQGSYNNHDERRTRKLLLNKEEIEKIDRAITQKGYTLVPLALYFKKGKAKIEIGLARGKKMFDKRASLAEKDARREIDRRLKQARG